MFVTTANTLNILPPLLDRMEVIRISGYTEDEKVNIAQKYLIPNQSKNNGLKKDEWNIDEEINRKIHFFCFLKRLTNAIMVPKVRLELTRP